MQSQRNAAKSPKSSGTKKSKKGLLIALCAIALAAAIGLILFFGFREGGWFREDPGYDAATIQSLREYAEKLEKAGNSEAAAAVYELIAKGISGERIPEAHAETPVLKDFEELEQFHAAMNPGKGGDAK